MDVRQGGSVTRSFRKVLLVVVVLVGLTPRSTIGVQSASAAVRLPQTPAGSASARAYTHALLIDGRGGGPVEDATIVVRGDRIEAAGVSGAVAVPPGAD